MSSIIFLIAVISWRQRPGPDDLHGGVIHIHVKQLYIRVFLCYLRDDPALRTAGLHPDKLVLLAERHSRGTVQPANYRNTCKDTEKG